MAPDEREADRWSNTEAEVSKKLEQALEMNLDKASPSEIESRIDMSLQADTNFDQIVGIQMGQSRVAEFLKTCEHAVRGELCQDGKLKETWANFLKGDDTAQLLKTLATTLLGMINPAFAAPSVAVLVALWLFRRGLENWCSHTVQELISTPKG